MNNTIAFLQNRKYELLLLALLQHLFIGIFLTDLHFYTRVVWPINMLILGLGSIFIFTGKHSWRHWFRNIHFIIVLLLPIGIPFFKDVPWYFTFLNINYVIFFVFLFLELLRFLMRPGYINSDIISASACGYFLLIEISVFLLQTFEYSDRSSFKGLDTTSPAGIFSRGLFLLHHFHQYRLWRYYAIYSYYQIDYSFYRYSRSILYRGAGRNFNKQIFIKKLVI